MSTYATPSGSSPRDFGSSSDQIHTRKDTPNTNQPAATESCHRTRFLGLMPGTYRPSRHRTEESAMSSPLTAESSRISTGRARRAARIEDLAWMAETGETVPGAAARLHVHPQTVRDYLYRVG